MVSEHFLEQSRPDLFLSIFHDGVPIAKIERAVTAFASLPDKLEMVTALLSDFFESLEELVSIHSVLSDKYVRNSIDPQWWP